jgi:uncharacterized lipoprotein YajG
MTIKKLSIVFSILFLCGCANTNMNPTPVRNAKPLLIAPVAKIEVVDRVGLDLENEQEISDIKFSILEMVDASMRASGGDGVMLFTIKDISFSKGLSQKSSSGLTSIMDKPDLKYAASVEIILEYKQKTDERKFASAVSITASSNRELKGNYSKSDERVALSEMKHEIADIIYSKLSTHYRKMLS